MRSANALILLSGGLDSVTTIAWARQQDMRVVEALSFLYGQRHTREIDSAAAVAAYYDIPHHVITLMPIRGSRLTDVGGIPRGRNLRELTETIAPTYVPNRNMILLSYAAAHALLGDVTHLIGGWNLADALNYPDCRDAFLESAQHTLWLATQRNFTIVRPLINDSKAEIVRRAIDMGAPLHLTWTCYLGHVRACGTCDACQMRVQAFREVGVIDPIRYEITIDWSGCRPYEIGRTV